MAGRGMSGRHIVQLDQRGRISFPALFRSIVGETLFISPDLDHLGHLVVRSEEEFFTEFDELAKELKEPGADKAKIRWEMRQFTGRTDQVSPDKNGRITLPSELIAYAGLHDKVIVVGVGQYAEIWDAQKFLDAEKAYEDSYAEGE